MSIKTILVDDEPLAIAELQSMLKTHEDIEVVAVSYDANEALSKIRQQQP
jgi:DNA-binding NarL/FixJ family response regulator